MRFVLLVIATTGLRVDRFADPTWRRSIGTAGIALHVLIYLVLATLNWLLPDDLGWIITFLAIGWVAYYGGNTLILIARTRKREPLTNPEQAFARYELVAAVMFQLQAIALYQGNRLSWSQAGWNSIDPLSRIDSWLLWAIALPLLVFGVIMKLWAMWLTGIDTYFYKDMFTGKANNNGVTTSGPYRLFVNPMYGVGYLHAYALALLVQSTPSLVFVFVCQVSIYAFYLGVERPFVVRTYLPTQSTLAS